MAETETLLTFPCSFPVKIMGRDKDDFRDLAIALVTDHAGKVSDSSVKTSVSSNGNYLSITITIQAKSQQQLDDIYGDLSKHEAVLVAL